ncbi:hypothetical protein ACH4SP_29825 [Streptomyces sp. NPDC021093]|uniref:hypothetical protein n=1 Tax=Streptomyces sp. NPDC021093 TaxID=3365112 RepID=UPI0037989148
MTIRRSTSFLAMGLTSLAVLATACAGSADKGGADAADRPDSVKSDSAAGSGGGTTSKNSDDKAVKHRQCLREHGLKVPDPKPGESGVGITLGEGAPKDTLDKAMKACAGTSPGGPAGGRMTQADKDKGIKHAQCMRKNGFNMPDPDYEGGSMRAMKIPKGEELKKFEKASKACAGIYR